MREKLKRAREEGQNPAKRFQPSRSNCSKYNDSSRISRMPCSTSKVKSHPSFPLLNFKCSKRISGALSWSFLLVIVSGSYYSLSFKTCP